MIEIKNLDFGYKKSQVFHNINLQFKPGNIYGLLGENGVGKTTLLKLICGLQRPSTGSCTIDGVVASERYPDFLGNIVYMPDETTLPNNTTPLKYITKLAPFYPKYAAATFFHLMQEFEVDPGREFKAMSYGQQKKALIACALSLGTDYVLLDEPTNGLDIPSKSQFRTLLSKRVQEQSTIIIATHQVKDVENLIDPIVILSHDDVLLNATAEDIMTKLFFEYGGSRRDDALYSEMLPGGYMNVIVNESGDESPINIEALFNAVLRNKNVIKTLFK